MNADVAEIVQHLKFHRERLGIGKRKIAQACNTRPWVLTLIENGEIDPTATLLHDYAAALGLTLTWSLGTGTEEQVPAPPTSTHRSPDRSSTRAS